MAATLLAQSSWLFDAITRQNRMISVQYLLGKVGKPARAHVVAVANLNRSGAHNKDKVVGWAKRSVPN